MKKNIKSFQTKNRKIVGTNFKEVYKNAQIIYREITKKTKRRPYLRSKFFQKEKIFLELFWEHLYSKDNWRDRMRRLKFFECALELIQNTTFVPQKIINQNNKNEILYKFAGISREGIKFFVQIKENKNKKQKYFISVFPAHHQK